MLSQRKSFFRRCRTARKTQRSSSGYSKLNPTALKRAGKTRSLSRMVASAISPKASRKRKGGTRSSVGR